MLNQPKQTDMSTWHKLNLGNGADAEPQTRQIRQTAFGAMAALPNASGFAIYSRYDLEADNVEVYFSPEAHMVAKAFGAEPCARPSNKKLRLGLLFGDANALLD